ncbi:PAS domain S-box-containing protein [Haloplanus vescus]|uniref:histidine kinase n=1 Tax=Haloplanus vescus TaxID=555874 RepID=A0A1H3YN43_9EURY|nr:PAS domain S-box protein [Haloplanus vescus]SEA12601.1 PAS domain S-box-containing protein [Haloplanus vescus]
MATTDTLERLDEIVLLHVDDDASFAQLASTFLERQDDRFRVETATSVDEGLARLDDCDVDCIVSDYDMPGQTGIDFLETVRDRDADLPFILYTGKGSETVASDAFSAGATDYLQKASGTEQYTLLANKVTNYVEKYRAEREVHRRSRAMQTATEGIAILDAAGRYVSLNEAYADICGIAPDDLVGECWDRTLTDAEAERLRAEAFPKLAAQSPWSGEATGRRPDGSTYLKQLSLAPLEDGGHVCIVRDITEQRKRERERRRYEHMLNAMTECVGIYDHEGRFVAANESLASFYDLDPQTLEGRHSALIQRLRDSAEDDPYRELLAGERDELCGEFEDDFPNHGHALVEYRFTPLTIDGDIEGAVGVARTVTDRERREWQFRRYERIVEVSGDPVYTLDTDGNFTFVNDRFVELTGYDRDAILGEHVSLLMDDEDIETGRRLITSLLTGDDDRDTFEMDVTTASGSVCTCEANVALVVTDGEFRGTVGVLRDITERKRRAAELRRKNDRLERFTDIVSHDLRNPLNVAQGRLELARETVDDPDHLDTAAASLDRCQRLIDDLLSLARDGKYIDDTEPVSLAAAARESWRHVETGDATLAVDTEATVRADRSRLHQLLENLVRNAVDHGPTGGDRAATLTITVGDCPDGFYVADDGPGIPPDERAHVFDSGYSTSADGTGFGLSIVRAIAEAHEWSVAATESDDGGARIEVTGVESA